MFLTQQRRLIALYLLFILIPAGALIGLGWRLLEQEQVLENQRTRDRLVETSQFAATSLAERMSIPTEHSALLSDGGIVVRFTRSEVVARPRNRLVYYPVLPAWTSDSAGTFALAETLELRDQEYDKATSELRRLAQSPDAATKAGSILRIARVLRKAGQTQAALDAYAQLGGFRELQLEGVPAGLIAARTKCSILAQSGRLKNLHNEAVNLVDDLMMARWQLLRPAYLLHINEAQQWAGVEDRRRGDLEALAFAVDWLWQQWNGGRIDANRAVRRTLQTGDVLLTLIWQGDEDRLDVLVATMPFAQRHWFEPTAIQVKARGATYLLRDNQGAAVWNDAQTAGAEIATRNPSETNLPWTIVTWDPNSHEQTTIATERRRLLLGSLGLLVAAVAASAYFVTRSVSRELAVAQLHADFVAAVSHEFRTPLTAMRQFTEFLQDKRVTDESRRDRYHQALARATERLQRLVESLLDFRRIEAGSTPYALRALDAAAWIRSETEAFGKDAAEAGYQIDLTVSVNADPCYVMADPDALTRALWNLMDNAVKYSPDSKTIWVKLETNSRNRAWIEVQDRGIGIPKSEHGLIFKKFFRGAQAKSSGTRGTGIGLAMVHQIVAAHSGKIRVLSSPGEGTRFTIDLPRKG